MIPKETILALARGFNAIGKISNTNAEQRRAIAGCRQHLADLKNIEPLNVARAILACHILCPNEPTEFDPT